MIAYFLVIMIIFFSSFVSVAHSQIRQNFFGVKGELLKQLNEKLEENREDLNSTNIKDIEAQTTHHLQNTLATYGYFKPTILSTVKKQGTDWVINYTITPHSLLVITRCEVRVTGEGSSDPKFNILLRNFPIKQGEVLRSKYYQEAKSKLVDLASERGYFAAKIEQSTVLIDLKKYESTVILHFNTGPRYYFGEVSFLPSPYSSKLLRRFIPFKHEAYQAQKIIKFQENLSHSNFFQQVTITPLPSQAKGLNVPIKVEIVPRKPRQYILGAGYGTDTGVRGCVGIQLRRLNAYGHQTDAMIQASQKLNHIEANYTIPGWNPVTDLYQFSIAGETENLNTSGKSRNEKIEASQIKTIGGWQQTLSISLRDEHSMPTNGRPTLNSTMLLPNLNWSKTKSDDLLNPNYGYQININLRGASKALISNTDFLQFLVQAKGLASLSSTTRLALKGQLGYTLISNVDQLPISLQFYTGGSQTVRGYQFQGIGPGKTLVMGSLELQQKVIKNLYATIFTDAGSASDGFIKDLKKSIGVGLLWRSPMGAVEVTLAEALDQPHKPKLIQFSIGSGL